MQRTIHHVSELKTGDRVKRVRVKSMDEERLAFLDHLGTVQPINTQNETRNNFDVVYDEVDGIEDVEDNCCDPKDFEKLNNP